MIIKSISWKQGSRKDYFLTLLNYINKGDEKKNTAIFHNLRTDPDDIKILAEEFAENATYSPKRKNGVVCYHEILSFPGKATQESFSPALLEDLAQEYMRLRAPYALGYAKLHNDTEHPHIHFCISGNLIKQKTKNRLSRAEFTQVKAKIRTYARKRLPELPHLPSPTVKNKPLPAHTQHQLLRPRPKHGQTIKAELSEKILNAFECTKNKTDALAILAESGIAAYQRGKEKLYGVVYQGKKYRLSTLGVNDGVKHKLNIWECAKKRFKDLDSIDRAKERLRDLSFYRTKN